MSMFRHVATLGDGITPFVTGIADLDLVEVGGQVRLYSAARPISGGGVASFDVETQGAAVLLDRLGHSGVSRAGDAPALVVATGWQGGTEAMVLTAGFLHLASSGIGVAGSTGAVGRRTLLPEGGLPAELRALDRLVLEDGRQILVSLDAAGQVAQSWTVTGTGALAAGPVAGLAGPGWDRLALADLGGRVLVLAAAQAGHRLAVLLEDGAGRLQPVQALGPEAGIGIALPSALAVVRVEGVPHALVAGAGSSSVTVFRIGTDGRLAAVDHVVDGAGTRFAAASALETVELAGRAYVLAGGGDQGLSLMLLLPSGRLVHLDSLAGTAGVPLTGLAALAVRAVAGAGGRSGLQLFAAGQSAGIAQIEVDLGVLAPPQRLGGAGTLTGGDGNDLLLAGAGTASLSGGAGDDILVAGTGDATLTGGAGADLFVLAATGGRIRVTDFDPAEDRLDLSAFPMLRSLGQLSVTVTAWGLRLAHGETVIELVRGGPVALSAADLTDDLLGGFTRLPIGGIPLALSAGDGGEQLAGLGADDRLTGGRGNDTLSGGAGRDTIAGGEGDDVLRGGEGRDRLDGGAGKDTIVGGSGSDRLAGGRGRDRLDGGKGDDLLAGGQGDDVLRGGAGDDRLLPGPGSDILHGGKGADTFVFLPGDARPGEVAARIADFRPGLDRIDLTAFGLAQSLGSAAFTGQGGEVRIAAQDSHLTVQIDLDGDRRADLLIRLDGLDWPGPGDLLI